MDNIHPERQPGHDPDSASDAGAGRWPALLAAGAALLLIGILFGAALWILAAVAAGLMVGVNHLLAKAWSESTVAVRRGGDAEGGSDREVKIGSRVPVEVAVSNRGRLPVLWLLAEDLTPRWATGAGVPHLRIEGERLRVMMLMPGETKTIDYEVICHRRGYFQIGPTVLETGDLMGLFRRYRVGAAPQFVTALPQIHPLSGYDIGSRRPIGEIRIRDSVIDDPTRLRGIRQWQPGDPMRSVHWAATARTGTLHSKVYEPSSIAGATLVLELHETTNPVKHEPVRSDLAVAAAASIATALHDLNEPFGLATNGRDAAERVRNEGWAGDHRVRNDLTEAVSMKSADDRLRPLVIHPGRGPVHLKQVTRTLARLDRTDGLTLAEFLTESEPRLSRETTLLAIAQECPPASIAALVGLARRGWAVAVILNTYETEDYSQMAGPLIAENIPTFHLSGPDAITDICRQLVMR